MWEIGEGQTDTQMTMANIHFASAMPHAKCNYYNETDVMCKLFVFRSLSSLIMNSHIMNLFIQKVYNNHAPHFSRAPSFLQKILPNSTNQFAKFCSFPRENHQNYVAYTASSHFMSKLRYLRCEILKSGFTFSYFN